MTLGGRRVLVTGGTGFIGGRTVERLVLEQEASVRVLVRNRARAVPVARLPVDIVQGSVADAEAVRTAVRGCDVVLHCAHDLSSRRAHWTSGREGTRVVAEAALDEGVARMVHLSSFAVYGPTADGDLDERAPRQPSRDRYTTAKRAGEQVVLDLHRDRGLPVVVLQPTIVYGPFGGGWTAGRITDLRAGLVPLIDGGGGLCNAVYVDDVVDAMLLAVNNDAAVGERLLVSAAEPVTWRAFYGAFEQALGFQGTVDVAAADLARLARLERRRARRDVRRALLGAGRAALQREDTVEALFQLPTARALADFARSRLPEHRWAALRQRVRGPAVTAGTASRRLRIPDPTTAALYASATRVRIDKARDLLGYTPQFDFERGMARTTEWLRWARLV